MNSLKVTMTVAATALLMTCPAMAFRSGPFPSGAFHSGGVAECGGCHSMHNSFEGSANVTGMPQFTSGPFLLKAQDQSGSCLNCHQHEGDDFPINYQISTADPDMTGTKAPLQRTPGGDFGWLKKTYNFTIRGEAHTDHGERHGHNIVATDFGYLADRTLTVAPGGNYPAANLHCSSCHDPHGRFRRDATGAIATTGLPIFNSGSYNNSKDPIAGVRAVGVYRILGGATYLPKSMVGSGVAAFTAAPPAAVTASSYNRPEASSQVKTIYGQNMSEWCSNCHTGFVTNGYTSGMKGLKHPAGNNANLSGGYPAAINVNYNAYVTSGKVTANSTNGAYSSLVPFEFNTNDYAILKAKSAGTDPNLSASGTSNVMCLSCHRAHASGFQSMLRFFYGAEFMTVADASNAAQYDGTDGLNGTEGKIHWGKTMGETQAAYYDRSASTFGPWARSQCNKCHAKD